ncbi:MAG TPA: hypothetical protein VIW67_24415 [Terriglobales bacterium]|jgi:hypothetical protein
MKNGFRRHRYWFTGASLLAVSAAAFAMVWTLLAAVPAPVLKITQISSNQFQIVITNGVSTTNYEVFRTPVLADPSYPWTLHLIGSIGQTNFTVSTGIEDMGFFHVQLGVDADQDGSPDWQDGQPLNSGVGILTITIDSPANGSTVD